MSVLFLNVCRFCVPNIIFWGEFKKNFTLFMLVRLQERQNLRYFRCPVRKMKSWYESKPTWRMKHAKSILESFEYFSKISWKSIFVILSYTVSKLVHFLETECIFAICVLKMPLNPNHLSIHPSVQPFTFEVKRMHINSETDMFYEVNLLHDSM